MRNLVPGGRARGELPRPYRKCCVKDGEPTNRDNADSSASFGLAIYSRSKTMMLGLVRPGMDVVMVRVW